MNHAEEETTTPISQAATIEETSDYWNEHDPLGETQEVIFEVRAGRHGRVTIDPEIYVQFEAEAHERGVTPDTLANLWLAQHLRERTVHPVAPTP